ncbi:hypothetical protein MMC22_005428 [Lobaria immixta]|nr:hypothetical protein [Lobaria immixta]
MTRTTRRGSVRELAQRFETAEHAAPVVNITASAASSSLAAARDTSGISLTAAAMPISQPRAIPSARGFIGEHLMRRTEELLASLGARLPTPASAATATPLMQQTLLVDASIGARIDYI